MPSQIVGKYIHPGVDYTISRNSFAWLKND